MPELPEVETTKLGISPYCVGHKIKKVDIREARLRWPIPQQLSDLLKNQEVLALSRRSKYLLWHFKKGVMLMHLGMSGALRVLKEKLPAAKHDHVDIEFDSGVVLRFTDPRRFGAILWTENAAEHKLLRHLGPEPLNDEFDAAYLKSALARSSRPIKLAIMDAQVVVGVGNIYANEALFKARIHPLREARSLNAKELKTLVAKIKETLAQAIRAGGTTLKDFLQSDGRPGYFAQELLVYGRRGQLCVDCECVLEEIRLSNRSTVFCKECQKLKN